MHSLLITIIIIRHPKLLTNCSIDVSVKIQYCKMFPTSAPVLHLPMDEIQGSTIKGSISGRILGGVVLVQGKLENAISSNGVSQAIDFGSHPDKCFHNPDACTTGSTFSYWLKWRSVSTHGLIIHSGGYYLSSRGYSHAINRNGRMVVYVKSTPNYYGLQTSIGGQGKWIFVVKSWSPSTGIKMFVNGCIVATSDDRQTRTHAVAWDANFTISHVDRSTDMELDNLLAWDGELTNDEVWRLYMQAGQV